MSGGRGALRPDGFAGFSPSRMILSRPSVSVGGEKKQHLLAFMGRFGLLHIYSKCND